MKLTQILIAGLILMVVLNICTLGFIIYKSQRHKYFRGENQNRERCHGCGSGEHGGGPGKFLSKKLNLTPEQEAKLEEMRKPHEEKMTKLRALKDSLRKQAFQLVQNDPYDSVKANAVAVEIGNCHKEMEKEMVAHFRAIKALCTTKEQQTDFNEFIEHISNEKMHGGGMRGNDCNGDSERRRHDGHHHRYRKGHGKRDCQGRGDEREGHQREDNQKRDGQKS